MMTLSKLIDQIQAYRLTMIALGKSLLEAKVESIWEDEIGYGIDTWYDFIAQPEIGFSNGESNFLIGLANLSSVHSEAELSRVPTGTVKHMLKHGGDIMDAQVLSTKDFKKKNFETKHTREPNYSYIVMKVHEDGTMNRVYGDELETAKENITNG